MSSLATSTAGAVAETVGQVEPRRSVENAVEGAVEVLSRPSELRQRLLARIESFGRLGQGTLLLSVPAPVVEPEAMLDVADLPQAFLWHGPRGAAYAGQGTVHRLRAAGADRFDELESLARNVLDATVAESLDDARSPRPRLWGGMAFEAGAAAAPPWNDFGDGELFLPRLLYRADDGAATLTLGLTVGEAADSPVRDHWLDRLDSLLAGLLAESSKRPKPVAIEDASVVDSAGSAMAEGDDEAWVRQVEDIRAAIRSGEVEKIVAARRFRVAIDPQLRASTVLRRLARGLRSSTRFAFRSGAATFLGATPERLVSKRGLRLETEALAGTMESGGEHAAELLESGKDRHEQQLVTDSIVRRLEPLCSELEVAPRPTVRELREILHLHTPIRGVLSSDRHVLDLVEALHPTPAVGGVPTPEAVRWIADHETHPRGWYAAPVGWIDADGDGEFYVALRSCVLTGGGAYLYAGAGIVADSDPVAELRETELKIQSLLRALRT